MTKISSLDMSNELNEQLLNEIHKLRETGEALIDRVEDVAASIRYMTNNLLDEEYHPEMATGVHELALQIGQLVSLSSPTQPDKALLPVSEQVAQQCERCLANDAYPPAAPSDLEDLQTMPAELPLSLDARLSYLVSSLHEEANQLVSCEKLGEEAIWQWWENRITSIHAAFQALECLEEESVGAEVDLLPTIERLGGIPASLLPDQWPEDLIEAYIAEDDKEEVSQCDDNQNASEKGSVAALSNGHQQTLFGSPENDQVTTNSSIEPVINAPVEDSQEYGSQGGMDSFTPSLPDPHRPYTLGDYQSFCERREQEEISADQWKAEYHWLRQERANFTDHLLRNHNAQDLKTLALQSGCIYAKSQTKPQNAETIYLACLKSFVLGNSIQYNPMSEKIEEAIDRIVEGLTDNDFAHQREQQREQDEEHQKAIENPETLLEFNTFVRAKGEESLSDEQHLRRDRLYADLSRRTRIEQKSNSVQQFQSDQLDDLEFAIKEGYHEKRQCPLWIVQLSTRVERATYGELKQKAQQLGGWYSSFKKSDAGFQFLSQESAEKFAGLKEGNADRSEELEDRKIRKLAGTAERFAAMANRLTEQAEATLAADDEKLKNTHRRAEMAASTRARAREDLATAATLHSLAAGLQDGQATYLDDIRYAVQVETLRCILRRAQSTHIKHLLDTEHEDLSLYDRHLKQDELEDRRPDLSDIRFAEYPKPYLYRGHLEQAFAKLASTKGVKQVTAKMKKLLARVPQGQEFVEFYREHDIELLENFLGRAKAAGYNCYWFDHCLKDHKRLQAANICDAHELRAALAELVPHLAASEGDDPVTMAVDALRGKNLPDCFPTPKPLIYRMLELADIQGDDRVLEPSAGMGDILDAIRQRHPDVELQAVEQNRTFVDVLAAKGHDEITTFADFLAYQWRCDTIVMNPPFTKGADIDHVRHAYGQLSVGGRLVSVMSEGPFFRSDSKSIEFREWLCSLESAHDEELPADTFSGSDALRQTGVQTRLVTIDKLV